jgi:hypothetical protein
VTHSLALLFVRVRSGRAVLALGAFVPVKMSPPCRVDARRGLCGGCVRAAKWIPVVFIAAIVTWSYYAYVYHLCFLTIQSLPEQVLLLVLYHFFFAMFVWAYWRTVTVGPGTVPDR